MVPTRQITGERRASGRWEDGAAGCNVEEYVLQTLCADGGWQGEHVENGFMIHLFGLLVLSNIQICSELVAPGPALRVAPAGFGSPCWWRTHRVAVEQLAASIVDHDSLELVLRAAWVQLDGRDLLGVDAVRWGIDATVAMAHCLGVRVVTGVVCLLAREYYAWVHGLPDLMLWRKSVSSTGDDVFQARWVEVKGPGDSLRGSQRVWLARLVAWEAVVEVVHVLAAP